jgi:hypothetical protein
MWVYLSLLVAFIGAILLFVSARPGRWYDAGAMCFGGGLLAFLIRIGWHLGAG